MSRKTQIRTVVYSTLGVLVLLLFQHPYGWQRVFGPRIRGIPLSYRQDQYRRAVAKLDHRSGVAMRILALVGVKEKEPIRLAELDKDENMLPVVLSLVDDPDARVRAAVARSLAKHAEIPEACDGVLRLIGDNSPHVRAFRLLLPFGRTAVPFLVKALHDTDEHTLIDATNALNVIGPDAKEAVPALQALLRHSSFAIRYNALGALQRVDPEQYPPPKAEPE
jgi:HEAT repeat protein